MGSSELKEFGGILDMTTSDSMAIDTAHLSGFLHSTLSNFGQGVHATSTVLPIGATISPFAVSAPSSSRCDTSPSLNLETLGPEWFSQTDYGLGQVQEDLELESFNDYALYSSEFDITTNTAREFPTGQAPRAQETLPWALFQQTASNRMSPNHVLKSTVLPSRESEPRDFPKNSSSKSKPLPSLSSSLQKQSGSGITELKQAYIPSCGSGPPTSSTWLTRRGLNKKSSRTQSQRRSRSRRGGTAWDLELDGGYESSSDYHRTGRSQKEKTFACPFYRIDPMRHMDCINLKLMRIRDVKQHISRKHTRITDDCSRCWAISSSSTPSAEFIVDGPCECKVSEKYISVLGVSNDMKRRLASPVDRKLSSPEQWYSIWRIIFGDTTVKPQPYLGSVVEETVGMMKEYWQQEGDEIVRQVLADQQFPNECIRTSTVLKDLFTEVQARFEQKTCQPRRINEESRNRAENIQQQSMLLPSDSNITMQDPPFFSSPPSDCFSGFPEPSVPQSEPLTSSIPSWNAGTEDLVLLHTQAIAALNNIDAASYPHPENNRAPGWMPEGAAHQQMGDESLVLCNLINY